MDDAVMNEQDAIEPGAEAEPVETPQPDASADPADLPQGFDARVEAVLMSSDRAVDPAAVASAFGDARVSGLAVLGAVERLNEVYNETGRSFTIERVAGGLRLMTRPELASIVAAFQRGKQTSRLSRAALETLSIIAYKQPMTRAQLEAIRGVACGEVLRSLLERKLVVIKGRAEELGRPMLYGTSKKFLEVFGLASIRDLPTIGDLMPPTIEDAAGDEDRTVEEDEKAVDEAGTEPVAGADETMENEQDGDER